MAKENHMIRWYDSDNNEAGSIVLKGYTFSSAKNWAEKLMFRYPRVEVVDYYRWQESQDDYDGREKKFKVMWASVKKSECEKLDDVKDKLSSLIK